MYKVMYKRHKESTAFEAWKIVVNGDWVGVIERPTSATRVSVTINGRSCVLHFNSISTAKGYVKSFIGDLLQ